MELLNASLAFLAALASIGERSGPDTLERAFLKGEPMRLSDGVSLAADDLKAALSVELRLSFMVCGFGVSSTAAGEGDFCV